MATQASYVLYCMKFPDAKICEMKKRRDYLYLLGKELVVPEIKRRIGSTSYKCLAKEIKNYIDLLLLEINPTVDPTSAIVDPTSDVVDHTSDVVHPTSDVVDPTSDVVDPTSDVVDPTSDVVHPTSDVVDPTSDVVHHISDVVGPTSDVVDPKHITIQHSAEGAKAPISSTQPAPYVSRKGRCSICERRKDSKVLSICKICCQHVCNSHSTNLVICFNCDDKVRFD